MGRVDECLAEMARVPACALDLLNDTFSVWLDAGYNTRAHSALDGRTPAEVFAADPQTLRPVDQQALHDACRREETRKVDKTGCVKFRGQLVEIGAHYARQRITLRYAELPDGPHELTAFDGDRCLGLVAPLAWNRPFAPLAGDDDPCADVPATPPKRSRYLDALAKKGEHRRKAQGGMRFRQLEEPRDV